MKGLPDRLWIHGRTLQRVQHTWVEPRVNHVRHGSGHLKTAQPFRQLDLLLEYLRHYISKPWKVRQPIITPQFLT